ncbi:ceramidase [Ranunculus cassubicifolius]
MPKVLFVFLGVITCLLRVTVKFAKGDYLIGVGSYDMTGPAADVNMMGYANMDQVTAGVHFRLRARAFIVAESTNGPRFAFVNLDAGMASQLVTIKVLERLRSRYGDVYNEENLAISGTHTHAGPAGYLQYVVYSITSLGFVQQSFDAIVDAIEQCIIQAHTSLKPGSIFINTGDVDNAGINRSPSAYLLNPPEERAKYPKNIDTEMTLLKFIDNNSGKSIGAFNWYATHGTSMSRDNKLISGDNKGVAARLFEDWFTSNNSTRTSNSSLNREELIELAGKTEASGGKTCLKTTSQSSKVRKNDGSLFVGAFCQSNVGDVSPNVLGAFCTDTGVPCDFNHSSCNGNDKLCVGRGPGYPDEILSTKIIGGRQFTKAIELFSTTEEELTGKIDYRHVYLNFTNLDVHLDSNTVVKTCPAALGPGFAAGTTDGPGAFGFQQGDTEINDFLKMVRNTLLKDPSQYQVDCQKPKTVLLDTGEMFDPYPWAPAILPIQILRLGKLVILSVPGEFTTMAGRRLREAVKETLIQNGNGEFDESTHVVIAGLTNTYSQYIATVEEYRQQRYEGASTLYGPHTLSAYIQEFNKLATSMAKGENILDTGLYPPDLSSAQISLVVPPLSDPIPSDMKFGDIKQDIVLPEKRSFGKGEKVDATFWSGNPRNDLLTEGTFSVVERLQDAHWIPTYDDDDLCLSFKWGTDNSTLYGLATIEWEISEEIPGVYRLRHYGASKDSIFSPVEYFTGTSSAFAVS